MQLQLPFLLINHLIYTQIGLSLEFRHQNFARLSRGTHNLIPHKIFAQILELDAHYLCS